MIASPSFLTDLILLSVASGTLALTLTCSHITKALRHRFIDAPFMIGELINCPYCMAHWTALPFVFTLDPLNVPIFIIEWLTITGLSSLFVGVLLKLFLFREGENEDLRETVREMKETINELV